MGDEERDDIVEISDEDESVEVTEAVADKSTSKIIKILFYGIGVVVLLFLVVGISYLVTKNVQEKKYEMEEAIVVAPPPPPLAHFDIPSFSVTTRDSEPHFAKVTVSLGYEDNMQLNMEFVRRTVQIQHIINIILSGKSYEDLDSVEDKINLAEEIKAHINALLIAGKVKEVYFREIVVN
ncbi:MAG: flagellar basal body-associated FliL family protein [Spirochaetota bacterium]|nr:flagellar basal body-associated FliL family protein [Spirochaetota bacterium]